MLMNRIYPPLLPHALFLYSWYSIFMLGIIWGMWTISCPPFVDRNFSWALVTWIE